MPKFYVEKQATVWFRLEVEAENAEEAVDKADQEYNDNRLAYFSETDGYDLTGAYWVGDEDGEVIEAVYSNISLEVAND